MNQCRWCSEPAEMEACVKCASIIDYLDSNPIELREEQDFEYWTEELK
jgi:hypothetical protein